MAEFSVFTKPWKTVSTEELIGVVKDLGFSAIEYPLRDGYQVGPDEAEARFPAFVGELAASGIRVDDTASSATEPIFAACAASGVPMIRVMFLPRLIPGVPYQERESAYKRELDGIIPLCDKYGVKVGLQMHCGPGATTAADTMRIIGGYDPRHIGIVWDAAHSGLAGEEPEQSIDLAWSHLCLVNFKNARYQMMGRADTGEAEYRPFFCPGPDGQCSWPRAVSHLRSRGYAGTWCMPAEYSETDNDREIKYAKRDLRWLKSLVED